jgi:hypothetical protein
MRILGPVHPVPRRLAGVGHDLFLDAIAHKVNGGLVLECIHQTRRGQLSVFVHVDWFIEDDHTSVAV